MKNDIRDSQLFQEAEQIARLLMRPGSDRPIDVFDLDITADNRHAFVTGVTIDELRGRRTSRIFRVDLESNAADAITSGPNSDRTPRACPNGDMVAFVSDRLREGDFQLYLLSLGTRSVRSTPRVDGWIEYLYWSVDGTRILLGVAGHGADAAGAQGAITSRREGGDSGDSWLPSVESGEKDFQRRSVWIYNLNSDSVRKVTAAALNIWEANWCGASALVAVASRDADESAWYSAALYVVDIEGGHSRELYKSHDQLGCVSASPTGTTVSFVEAVCSDRWCVAGDLLLFDICGGKITRVPTKDADICHTRWRDAHRLLLGAHRRFETLVMEYDATTQAVCETWADDEVSASGIYITPVPLGDQTRGCAFVAESFTQAPHIAVIESGGCRAAHCFDGESAATITPWIDKVEQTTWTAPDGTQIEGWLLLPAGRRPFPLVMCIHGGPVYSFRPQWLGRTGISLATTMLLKRGYAIFQPNPRGSSGRGQDFARKVRGDLNGADTLDYLSGLDSLVMQGVADPSRMGVMGGSYGGNMTCWLVTQDYRFAAAVAVAPHCDQVSQHLTSNIPSFDELFIGGKYNDLNGKYYQRSAIMYAENTRTPTLLVAGALDRCTPAGQAIEFHNSLRLGGVKSELVIYPQEGHGIRQFPAMVDFAARTANWFEAHMPSHLNAT